MKIKLINLSTALLVIVATNIVNGANCANLSYGDWGQSTLLDIPINVTDNTLVSKPYYGTMYINERYANAVDRDQAKIYFQRIITKSAYGFCGMTTTYQGFNYSSPSSIQIIPTWGIFSYEPGFCYTLEGHYVSSCTMGGGEDGRCKRYSVGKQEIKATHSFHGYWVYINIFQQHSRLDEITHEETVKTVTTAATSYWEWMYCPPEEIP